MDGQAMFLGLLLAILATACISRAEYNACQECSRHPETCRRISGLYTVTVLTEGTYNPVVEIPPPACSINITEFRESSNYIALKTKKDQGLFNSHWGLGQPGTYQGAGTTFTYERGSSTCRGTCIYSDGPTNEILVVQILYYDKNPGIAYTFILPNNVPFTPFSSPVSKQVAPSGALTDINTFSSRHNARNHRGYRTRQPHSNQTDGGGTEQVFEGEYYAGHHSSRSEIRSDWNSGQSSPSKGPSQQSNIDYTGSRYGTHTLGGRGMSYTEVEDYQPVRKEDHDRLPGRHIVDRVHPHTPRSGHPSIRKLPSPEYIAHQRQQQNAQSRLTEPSFRSFSAGGSTLDSRDAEQFDISNSINGINTDLGQVRNHGASQYRWKISGFTDCTQTCGGGVQKTNIVCVSVNSRTQVVVTSENCADHLKPKTQTVQCNAQPCEPAWEAKDWSQCSVTCGSGTQSRIVECQQRFSPFLTLKVSADQCGLENKPAIAQQCEADFCSQWKLGPWSECSKSCGGGEKKRNVQCVDSQDTEIPSSHCTETAPKHLERCNTHPCTSTSQWWISEWSGECSNTCEAVKRTRSAVCFNKRDNIISLSSCNKQELPTLEEACPSNKYCLGSWFVGQWSKCSAECGHGKRTRQVLCVHYVQSSFNIIKEEECNLRYKPKTEETCSNTNCNSKWYASPWSECSVTCGDGHRSRDIRCVEDNKEISDICDNELKPATHESCSLPSCAHSKLQSQKIIIRHVHSNNTRDTIERKLDDGLLEDDRKIRHRQPQHHAIRSSVQRKHDKNCKDNFYNCLMVIQARLCTYNYYRKLCCESCQKFF